MMAAAAMLATGCGADEPDGQDAKTPSVFVTIEPLAYLAERVAGGHMAVEVLVRPGQEPHTYSPTPKQIVGLGKAKLLFRTGMPFEEAIAAKLSSARNCPKMANLTDEMDLLPMGEHHDPHVWMSPRLAKGLAGRMCREFCLLDPGRAAEYRANLRALAADLEAVDAKLTKTLAPLRGRTFFVFHAAFAYFARDYGLRQQAVETGGKSPGPRQIEELIDRAKANGVKVIFVQPQFSDRAARAVAEQIGGAVVPLDPLARDYIKNLERIAAELAAALKEK